SNQPLHEPHFDPLAEADAHEPGVDRGGNHQVDRQEQEKEDDAGFPARHAGTIATPYHGLNHDPVDENLGDGDEEQMSGGNQDRRLGQPGQNTRQPENVSQQKQGDRHEQDEEKTTDDEDGGTHRVDLPDSRLLTLDRYFRWGRELSAQVADAGAHAFGRRLALVVGEHLGDPFRDLP